MSLVLPYYEPGLFTDRLEEVHLVEDTMGRLAAGEPLPSRTIAFRGASGLGKSWLALQLKRVVLPRCAAEPLPLFIGLGARYEQIVADPQPETEWYYKPSPKGHLETVRLLTTWIAAAVGAASAADATPHQITSWLVQALGRGRFGTPVPRYRFLALVLDSVFEAEWAFLEVLETALLAALAALPNVLIIITGRGRAYPWRSPYLNIPLHSRDLGSFVAEKPALPKTPEHEPADMPPEADRLRYLREQLRGQMGHIEFTDDQLRMIAEIGEGYPKNNLLVAQALAQQIDPSAIVDELLSFIEDRVERQEIRSYLEALCILDGFREDQIGPLYNLYRGRPESEWSLPRSREVRNRLVERHVVRWDSGRFVIDRSLRSIMNYVLREQDRQKGTDLVPRLHQRAAELYEEWAEMYDSDYYHALAQRHRAQISTGATSTV